VGGLDDEDMRRETAPHAEPSPKRRVSVWLIVLLLVGFVVLPLATSLMMSGNLSVTWNSGRT